jgi:hypothetical protein
MRQPNCGWPLSGVNALSNFPFPLFCRPAEFNTKIVNKPASYYCGTGMPTLSGWQADRQPRFGHELCALPILTVSRIITHESCAVACCTEYDPIPDTQQPDHPMAPATFNGVGTVCWVCMAAALGVNCWRHGDLRQYG